ncbi:MAG: YitT family protein [Proteobacteria bacterium]|nr:YitT family protein [Pseudomonadota bacterium]
MTDPAPLPEPARHSLIEDVQGVLIGSLFVGLAVVMFRDAALLTGGTTGLAFLLHYSAGWPLGALLFILNLPFYVFGLKAIGTRFTVKTFCAVGILSLYTELLPRLVTFARLDPVFAAIMAGLLAGTGILILIRHGASLGGIGVLAIYLQKTRGWRAGTVQMVADSGILGAAFAVVAPDKVVLSVLGAFALNLVIMINHRPDRYFGV